MIELVLREKDFVIHVPDEGLEVLVGILEELVAQGLVGVTETHSK